jgi:glycerophosphoryl diester phosphodiesterase
LLLGHRGSRRGLYPSKRNSGVGWGPRGVPENTFAAFDKALRDGCDGFEFDVRLSADRRPVICHDPHLHGFDIARSTLDQLSSACKEKSVAPVSRPAVRGASAPAGPGGGADETSAPTAGLPPQQAKSRLAGDPGLEASATICCLEEVLAKYVQCAYLDIELKVAGLEEITLELLRRYPGACAGAAAPGCPGVVISSFLPEVLQKLAELQRQTLSETNPHLPTAADVGHVSKSMPDLAENSGSIFSLGFIFARREHLRGWERMPVSHLMPRHDLLDQALLGELHAAGKQVIAWTVNRERDMRRLAEMGVDGLVSDDTQLLSHTFTGNVLALPG